LKCMPGISFAGLSQTRRFIDVLLPRRFPSLRLFLKP
jgi:hypothetical protein